MRGACTAQYAAGMVALRALGWTKKGSGEEDTEGVFVVFFFLARYTSPIPSRGEGRGDCVQY